jgi:hypothetical protein
MKMLSTAIGRRISASACVTRPDDVGVERRHRKHSSRWPVMELRPGAMGPSALVGESRARCDAGWT